LNWRCSCGEVHAHEFDTCWRCGLARPDERENDRLEPNTESQARRALEEAWDRAWAEGLPPRADIGLSNLRTAYRYYRARQQNSSAQKQVALDRSWILFQLVGGICAGFVLAHFVTLSDQYTARCHHFFTFGILILAGVLIILGRRTIRAEFAARESSHPRERAV
jgi:hypothetical protein